MNINWLQVAKALVVLAGWLVQRHQSASDQEKGALAEAEELTRNATASIEKALAARASAERTVADPRVLDADPFNRDTHPKP